MRTVSGTQHLLRAGDAQVWIASIGASLRAYRYGGVDLVMPFRTDEERPAMRGALLAPWPNRTADARYRFGGVEHVLAMNEPERQAASHGLVTELDFDVREKTESSLVLRGTILPRPGYPWRVRLDVRFALDEHELAQSVTATNESATPAPFGLGGHPYLLADTPGAGAIDAWTLELPAEQVLLVDPERLLPKELVGVAAHDSGAFDFRRPRRIGRAMVNNAFTGLRPDDLGRKVIRLRNTRGSGVEIELGAGCGWAQIYTADAPGTSAHRHALAVEPMTCPPDALNSGLDLQVLAAGGKSETSWTLRRTTAEPIGHRAATPATGRRPRR